MASAIVFTLLGLPLTAYGEPIRDQGQIFGTGGELQLGTDEWSQSITTGITGQLVEIQIQFRPPTQPPELTLSIFDGGNPISGSALFSERLTLTGEEGDLFTWNLRRAKLLFDAGDVFSFVLQADAAGYDISGNDPPGYDDGDLFKNRVAFPELSDIAFITYVKPSSPYASGKEGMDIKIRAQNRTTADTPSFCPAFGAGLKGDRLDVDVSTASDGSAAGTARFEDANGNVTLMNIDRVVVFGGGLLLEDTSTFNVVPIWFGDTETGAGDLSPMHVNVEIPRGCENTKSTFTVGKDKTTLQIKTN
jgi:hypothetical protein